MRRREWMMAVALTGVVACQSQEGDDELQALLRDGELTNLAPGVATGATSLQGAHPEIGAPADAGISRADAGTSRGDAGTSGADAGSRRDAGTVTPPDGGGGGGGGGGLPFGQWAFDDCNPDRTNLSDSGPFGNTAFRTVGVTCASGVAGQAVSIAVKEDMVYVPDQPNFTFENGVTVAAWFEPTSLTQTRTLFRKRDKDTSSFALVLNSGKFQFVVNLGDGRAASVTAPTKAKTGVFQHVAGTYDGATLRLYVNGAVVTSFTVAGAIPPGPGPLLMGNDGSERRFAGLIDSAFFAGHALSTDEVLGLTCIQRPPTLVTSPRTSQPTVPGVPATFDIAFTNHNPPSCAPLSFAFVDFALNPGITIDPPSFVTQIETAASGTTRHVTLTATASDSIEEGGDFTIPFQIFSLDPTTSFFFVDSVDFVVAEPTGCHVSQKRELMIKDVSVVDDPVRTSGSGAWTFKHLMENMAPTPADAPAMVEAMLQTFGSPQTINGFTVAPRPGMQNIVLSSWPRTEDGALDLAQAPLRLQAIVNRFDLRNLASGDAGEGRFVFSFTGFGSFPLQATLIFEYKLPAASDADVLAWANAFHALGSMPFSEPYNAALEAITERFAGRGLRPGRVNGSAINAVRTNEIDFGQTGIWELREFGLSADTGTLVPATIKLTPDHSFNFTDTLAAFINANQAAIIAETHTVPDELNGQPFLAGAVFNDLTTWFADGVDPEARHHFALNTCNGCHSAQETGTIFLQISPRFPGTEASLSGFLTGITVPDPGTGQPRTFNDLGRRAADLKATVCTADGAKPASLRRGISRVH